MRQVKKTIRKVCLLVFVTATAAQAQSRLTSGPAPAVIGPAYDISVGYSYLSMPVASTGRAGLNGLDFSGSIALSTRWKATIDSSYARTSEVLTTPHQGYMLSTLAGPVFSLLQHGNTHVFLRGMAGVALIDGAVPVTDTSYFHGWLMRPAYTFGGGVERGISERFAVRVNGDYLRTTFYDEAGTTQGQNNLRLTVGLVMRLKEHQRRSGGQVR